ncbi:MAG: transcriptional regulator [Acidipropionibacterium acidipropionici]|nr:transcriptional regulator [Acidipropionibacterium acidipropionici]
MEKLTGSPIALSRWDKAFTAPARYTIAATLAHQDRVSFSLIRKALGISATLMSKHVSYLEQVGYLTVYKVKSGRQVLTELSLTDAGRRAFRRYTELLKAVAEGAVASPGNGSPPTTGPEILEE